MLSTPENGWCLVSLGSWHDRGSFIDDVPVMLLYAVENVMLTGEPEVVYFDAEGWEYTLTIFSDQIRVTTNTPDEEVIVRTFNLGVDYIARALIHDIRRDLEEWVWWPAWADDPDFDPDARRRELTTYCEVIEALLPKNYS